MSFNTPVGDIPLTRAIASLITAGSVSSPAAGLNTFTGNRLRGGVAGKGSFIARGIDVDSSIYSPSGGSVGIGFAIPSKLAKTILAQLREHGDRGSLGVQMQPVTPALAKSVELPDNDGVNYRTVRLL